MILRKSLKVAASLILVPTVRWYLRKKRSYSWRQIAISVHPGVFHPGFFSSTMFLLSFLEKQNLRQQSLLELGCGTGLISIFAAKGGARATASDLSVKAIENTRVNAHMNQADVTIVHSDLFQQITPTCFDWIIINPPYYARNPKDEADLAWYCGENFDYYKRLFAGIRTYMHRSTQVIMVLTKGCDIQAITNLAQASGLSFQLIAEKKVLFDERDFLFRIATADQPST